MRYSLAKNPRLSSQMRKRQIERGAKIDCIGNQSGSLSSQMRKRQIERLPHCPKGLVAHFGLSSQMRKRQIESLPGERVCPLPARFK